MYSLVCNLSSEMYGVHFFLQTAPFSEANIAVVPTSCACVGFIYF